MKQELLQPEYLTAHIQNGLVVIQPHDQQATITSHSIYNGETIESNSSPLEMTTERHFIADNENVQMPLEGLHQSLHSNHSSMSTEHLGQRNHFETNASITEERKVIIGEQGRQYILTNEAPVIVSSKVCITEFQSSNQMEQRRSGSIFLFACDGIKLKIKKKNQFSGSNCNVNE